MKRTLNIGVDADGIIFNLFRFQLEKGKKFFKMTDDEINISEYDIKKIFNCTPTKRQLFWAKYIYNYCMHSPLVNDAVEILKKWKSEGHKLYNITARVFVDQRTPFGTIFRYMLEKRYEKEGIEFDGFDYCSEKESVRDKTIACNKRKIDIMLEDKSNNVEAVSKVSKVICFDWPYNRDCNVKNMIRVSSETGFKEADKIIHEYLAYLEQELGDKQYIVNGKFKRLNSKEEAKLNEIEMVDYYKQRKQYYAELLENKEEVEKQERYYKKAYSIINPIFKTLYNPQVFNKELIPYQSGVIFVSNHLDYKDQFTLLPLLGNRPIHFLAAVELLKFKRGKLYKNAGAVFVDRKSLRSKIQSFEEMAILLANNKDVFIFPEGTRNRDPKKYLLPFYDGPVLLSQITGAPIIPLAVNNNYSFRSKTLIACAGEPMIVRPGDDIKEKNQLLTEKIATLVWENMERVKEIEKGTSVKELKRLEEMKKMVQDTKELKKEEVEVGEFEKRLSLIK